MAVYNTFYPQGYPYQYNPFSYQQAVNQQAQQFQSQTQPQIQNGGFINVASIEEAYNWPVAPGNSVTFKIDNSPYVCTKTKGFSQLDQPIFEKYRLVKENTQETPAKQSETVPEGKNYDDAIKSIWDEINALKTQIRAFESQPQQKEDKPVRKAKKEAEENEQPE